MTILSWYEMEEAFNLTEVFIKETLLEEGDLSLTLSKLLTFLFILISVAELAGKHSIWRVVDVKAEEENYIFSKML